MLARAFSPPHFPVTPRELGAGALHPAAMALASGVDLLIHDAQYATEERAELTDFGHSCPEYAVILAEAAGARQLCLFHHAPGRTDDAIDELAGRFAGRSIRVLAAFDGMVLRLPAD